MAAGEADDDEGGLDAADLDELGIAVFFFDVYAIVAGAQMDGLLREAVVGEFGFLEIGPFLYATARME